MLVIMTYNAWLFIAVVIGMAAGYFLHGWRHLPSTPNTKMQANSTQNNGIIHRQDPIRIQQRISNNSLTEYVTSL